MRIVIHHPVRLPPKDYGGVERVVLWLAEGLVERGHDVFVAASPGSELPHGAHLLPVPAEESSPSRLAARLPEGIDIVHFMAPPGDGVEGGLPCPALTTVHGNGRPGEVFPRNTVFLTRNHAKRHGATAFVHNGIHPNETRFGARSEKGERFLFLSKTSWKVKNVRGAIGYCRRAGVPLTVAGGNRPLGPRLRARMGGWFGSDGLEWAGPVAGARKAELLARARALLFPVLWDEPFGLVVIEALMSGTPVIANRRGGLDELISPEVGRLIEPGPRADEEWVDFLAANEITWDPQACRDWAMQRFHFRVMAENYEKTYRRICAGEALHAANPRTPG